MKRQLCTIAFSGLLALGMGAAAASAQDDMQPQGNMQGQGSGPMHGHGMGNPDEQLARMTKHYSLTADQQAQLKPILVDHQQQMMQLHSDPSLSRQDKMAKMQSMRQDHMQKVEAILTPDQKAKFEKDQARMEEHRMEHTREGGGMSGAPDAGGAPPPPPPQ